MKDILTSLGIEILKIRRSKVLTFSIIFFAFVPCMMALIMFVQKYPEIAAKLGMIGTKSTMLRFGEANWTNYMKLISESLAAVGLIGFGFIISWIFGREYTDRTVKDLLALPVSRSCIVGSKLLAFSIWSALLASTMLIAALLLGRFTGLSGWNEINITDVFGRYFVTFLMTLLLSPPVSFLSSLSRGFLLPFGFIILTLLIANFTGLVGLAPYFPWAIPGLYSMSSGGETGSLSIVSYLILFVTSLAGLIATYCWWLYADQK